MATDNEFEVLLHTQSLFERASAVAAELLDGVRSSGSNQAKREYLLGMAAYVLRLPQVADGHLRASYQLEPSHETAARLALCSYRLENLEEGQAWITKALAADKAGALKTLVLDGSTSYLSIYATILLAAGRKEEALAAAESALKQNPSDSVALGVRADARLLEGDAASALQDFDHAIGVSDGEVRLGLLSRRATAEGMAQANATGAAFIAKSAMKAARHV